MTESSTKLSELTERAMKREFEFVRIAEIENQILDILENETFDFPAVPELPSRRKKVKRKTSTKNKNKKFTLRQLDPASENLYIVCCRQGSMVFQNATPDTRLIRKMLTAAGSLEVLSISTAVLHMNQPATIIEKLYPT